MESQISATALKGIKVDRVLWFGVWAVGRAGGSGATEGTVGAGSACGRRSDRGRRLEGGDQRQPMWTEITGGLIVKEGKNKACGGEEICEYACVKTG